ncbi:hypothetical protein BH09PLA1_BH09PLA1_25440 [soil metagenome]
MQRYFDAFGESPKLAKDIDADGVLIDTFEKGTDKGLLDYVKVKDIAAWIKRLHAMGKEAWLAGSITKEELPEMWAAGADVICVRGAACEKQKGAGRFGMVSAKIVKELVATIP